MRCASEGLARHSKATGQTQLRSHWGPQIQLRSHWGPPRTTQSRSPLSSCRTTQLRSQWGPSHAVYPRSPFVSCRARTTQLRSQRGLRRGSLVSSSTLTSSCMGAPRECRTRIGEWGSTDGCTLSATRVLTLDVNLPNWTMAWKNRLTATEPKGTTGHKHVGPGNVTG